MACKRILQISLVIVGLITCTRAGSDNAVAMFTLLSVQSDGGDIKQAYEMMESYADGKGNFKFDYHSKRLFLAIGGLDDDTTLDAIMTILPALDRQGKSIHEKVTALLVMSGKYCERLSNADCENSKELYLPMMTLDARRGCSYNDMKDFAGISRDDVCVCQNQDDVYLLMDMLNKMTSTGNKTEDEISFLAMIMLMNELTCSGYLVRDAGTECYCNKITMGENAFLMNRLLTDEKIKTALDENNFDKALGLAKKPQTRALDLQNALMGSISGSLDPSLLAIISSGGSSTDMFKNILLAQLGLDPATTYLFLNGGFSDQNDKTAMINYLANMGFFPPDVIPFLLGVEDGFSFYINSLLSAGAMDPIMALLLLSTKSTENQKDILEFIIEYIVKGMNPEDLAYLGKPYLPILPYGIYPGSELYFIHFESLGINTCSLHSLENRFDCGYVGINAAACEIKPYCCYNPIFLSDLKVREITDSKITTALDIPWCYFNIFFIYYDQFHLSVLRPGEFPSPASCKGLYKYNLDLEPTLYYLSNGGDSLLSELVYDRDECGFPGITEFHCVAIRGCCWDKFAPNQVPQCFKPNGPTTIDFNLNLIPTAYLPLNGTCSTNYYQSPILYQRRIACHYTIDYAKYGFNILQPPNQRDCLWNLGCCWEDNMGVMMKFPDTPRCYQREDGGYSVQPGVVPDVEDLLPRSGLVGGDERNHKQQHTGRSNNRHKIMRRQFAAKGFDPVEKEDDIERIIAELDTKDEEEAEIILKKIFENL